MCIIFKNSAGDSEVNVKAESYCADQKMLLFTELGGTERVDSPVGQITILVGSGSIKQKLS